MPVDGQQAGIERLVRVGAPEHAIEAFRRYYGRLEAGDRGLLPERDIEPLASIPDLSDLPDRSDLRERAGRSLDGVAVVRLNGGLGTNMAARGTKGVFDVKAGRSFVDLAVEQVDALRRRTSSPLPLLLMSSAATAATTASALAARRSVDVHTFLQTRLPRLRADDLRPIDWPGDPDLEWAPAGHGDVYPSLASSGWLASLITDGFSHACISSIDNVAFVVDSRVPQLMRDESIPFLMEVADRTDVDRKGGHLARRPDGGLVLRELAQTPPEDRDAFQDVTRHRYFNTNTIWVDLRALDDLLAARCRFLDLPLIANRKVVDPYDATSPEVIQIETAMGAAISVFPGASARRVDRRGFNPVKTTAELLAVRSDAYALTDDGRLELAPERRGRPPVVELDPACFSRQRDFDERFPSGPPSLIGCDRLTVQGDVVFGRDVVVRGTALVEHEGPGSRRIADGTVLGDG